MIKMIVHNASINKDILLSEVDGKYGEDIKTALSIYGLKAGGSGAPLNEEKYLESVKFWSENITVK
jgi:hypothetical protein